MNFFKRELIAGRVSLPGMGDYFMKGKQMKRVAVLLAASVLTAQCPVCPLKAQEKMTFMSENGFIGLEGSSSDYTIEFPEEPEIFNEFTSSFTEESKTSSEEITSTEESETSRKNKTTSAEESETSSKNKTTSAEESETSRESTTSAED